MSNNDKGATPRTDKAVSGEYAGSLDMEQVLSAVVEHARTLERELTESQARAARLEEALKECVEVLIEEANADEPLPNDDLWEAIGCGQSAYAANANSWLQERLKAERERAASLAESVRMDGSSGALIAAAIRALPEGE